MGRILVLGAAVSLALGCATSSPSNTASFAPGATGAVQAAPSDADGAEPAAPVAAEAASPAPEAAAEPIARTFRIGFWELDLVALDYEPRGTTFRLLDLAIFRLLDVGSGPDYHSFSLVEVPVLLNVFTTRREGITRELRVVDVQALALAFVRHLRESESTVETHFLKLPILGSLFAYQEDHGLEERTFLFLFRTESEH
jgi:hypothetical protein